MPPTLITCYVNPDLDGLASAFAYAEFLNKQGQQAQAAILGVPHDEAKYVLDRFKINNLPSIINDKDFSQVILVDSSDLIGLEGRVSPDKVIEIIDHRQINEADKFPHTKVQIELVGAAATLIAEKFYQKNIPISQESAILIYSAIISNTLNFRSSTTTVRDREMAQRLQTIINLPTDYWQELFKAKSDLTGSKLAERINGDFAWFILADKRIGIAQLEIMDVEELLKRRQSEIIFILDKIKIDLNLDFIFQNIIDLKNFRNFIITNNHLAKSILEKALDIKFQDNLAVRDQLIMRKQIVPLVKKELES